MSEVRKVGFKIQGEFITEQARIALYDKMHLSEALEILTTAMVSDSMSENEIMGLAVKILDGRADLVGLYPVNYRLEEHDDKPNAEFRLENITKNNPMDEIERLKQENHELLTRLAFVLEYVDNHGMLDRLKSEYRAEYGDNLCRFGGMKDDVFYEDNSSGFASSLLDARIERMKTGDRDDDYGWLEPNGTFHAVPWGDHQEWAAKYLTDLYEKGKIELEPHALFDAGKVLCEKNWVLVHSPSQGIPFVTSLNVRGMTKAQKEFMYDYYISRNQHKFANELYKED